MCDADAIVNGRNASQRAFHEAFMNEDILGHVAAFLDHRDLGAFRASCKVAYKATYSASSRLALDTRKRPYLTWGHSSWFKAFLPSFSSLRSLTLVDRGNNGQGYRAIHRTCQDATKRDGTLFDPFRAAHPDGTLALALELAPPTLRSFSLEKPTRLGRPTELSDELLRALAGKFGSLKRLRIRHYNLPAHAAADSAAVAAAASASAWGVSSAQGAGEDVGRQQQQQQAPQRQQEPHEGGQQQQQSPQTEELPQESQQQLPHQHQQQQAEQQLQVSQTVRSERQLATPLPPSSLPRTLRKLVLHCWPGRDFTTSEAWAVELAQLSNLRELDLGCGAGGFFCPASREVGMTVPWTPAVAEAWHSGLRRLRRLSVRLSLCLAPQGDIVPLQTHGSALPVNSGTSDLAVFFDDFTIAGWASSETFEEQGVTHEAYVRAALAVLVSSLEACGEGRLASLEVQLPKPQDHGDVFREVPDHQHQQQQQVQANHPHHHPVQLQLHHHAAQLNHQQQQQHRQPRAEIQALLRRLVAHYRPGIPCSAIAAASAAAAISGAFGAGPGGVYDSTGACGSGLEGLRNLALSVDTAGVLAPALRALLPCISPRCRVTLTVGNWTSHTDFLCALRLLVGRNLHLRVAKDKQLIYKWAMQAMEGSGDGDEADGEDDDEGGRSIKDVMESIQDEINVALGQLGSLSVTMDSFLGLPNVAATCAWPGHVEWLEGLGGVSALRALHLSFSYSPAGSRRWHEVADVDATLALVAENLRQLKVLSIHLSEELEQAGSGAEDTEAGESSRERQVVADWKAARAAARAGQDLDRWRPRGAPNLVPHLTYLAAMPSLERLDLELDLVSQYGMSGMVEDEVQQLLEARWREAAGGEAPWGRRPLRVWCPQLSRDAARRLSRLAAELLASAAAETGAAGQTSASAPFVTGHSAKAAAAGPSRDAWDDVFEVNVGSGGSSWSDSEDEAEPEVLLADPAGLQKVISAHYHHVNGVVHGNGHGGNGYGNRYPSYASSASASAAAASFGQGITHGHHGVACSQSPASALHHHAQALHGHLQGHGHGYGHNHAHAHSHNHDHDVGSGFVPCTCEPGAARRTAGIVRCCSGDDLKGLVEALQAGTGPGAASAVAGSGNGLGLLSHIDAGTGAGAAWLAATAAAAHAFPPPLPGMGTTTATAFAAGIFQERARACMAGSAPGSLAGGRAKAGRPKRSAEPAAASSVWLVDCTSRES